MCRNIDYTELERYVSGQVKPSRFAHCQSCATTMKNLLERFPSVCAAEPQGADAGLYVGLWHDVARGWKDADLLSYCQEHRLPMEPEELVHPMLLHGAVAADLMKLWIPGCPQSWETAVRWHTLGDVSMGRLGLALYVVDYLEPLRKHITEEHRRYLLALPTMEAMALRIIDEQNEYFLQTGVVPAACTERLHGYLESGGRL